MDGQKKPDIEVVALPKKYVFKRECVTAFKLYPDIIASQACFSVTSI